MNMISGSTGLSGAADSAFVLQKHSRLANIASLHCTGRDIPDRTLKLEFGEEDHPAGAGKHCGSKRKWDSGRYLPQQRQAMDFPQACRTSAPRGEARVAAAYGFLPRLQECAQQRCKSPRCADVQRTKLQSSKAIAILRGGAAKWMSFRALRGSEEYGAFCSFNFMRLPPRK